MKCYHFHHLFTDSKILCGSSYVNDVLDDYFSGRITPEDFEARIVNAAACIKAARAVERELKRLKGGRGSSVLSTPRRF